MKRPNYQNVTLFNFVFLSVESFFLFYFLSESNPQQSTQWRLGSHVIRTQSIKFGMLNKLNYKPV